jgi:hypothetical protein
MTQPAFPPPPLSPNQMAPYNLAAVVVILGGYKISKGRGASGYGPDVVISHKQTKPDFTKQEGADGSVTVSATNSVLTEFELTVMQSTSSTNGFLTAARIAAKAAGVPLVMPLLMQDMNGTTVFSALKCWIDGPPDQEFKSDAGPRTWHLSAMPELNALGGNGL